MKEDFINVRQELSHIGIVRVASDFYMTPKRKGARLFVKSPTNHDSDWSLCLFSNNTFKDFSDGRAGDIIGFISYIKGVNNWQALEELRAFYGLTNAREQDKQEARRKIELQKQKEQKKAERQQAFRCAVNAEIDRLKQWVEIYSLASAKGLFEPFSELWAYCINERQKEEYKLDILCGIGYTKEDNAEWLSDVLKIMEESGTFHATKEEIKQIENVKRRQEARQN